jgi:hypothetical protein
MEESMSLAELLPAVRKLPATEQLQLVRLVLTDLEIWEKLGVAPGQECPIWSPWDSYEAAAVLAELLKSGEKA